MLSWLVRVVTFGAQNAPLCSMPKTMLASGEFLMLPVFPGWTAVVTIATSAMYASLMQTVAPVLDDTVLTKISGLGATGVLAWACIVLWRTIAADRAANAAKDAARDQAMIKMVEKMTEVMTLVNEHLGARENRDRRARQQQVTDRDRT